MLSPEQRAKALQHLAAAITRAGLRAPLSLALDALSPLDIVSSQVALFVRPFTAGYRWEQYAAALTEAAGWQELRGFLNRQEY